MTTHASGDESAASRMRRALQDAVLSELERLRLDEAKALAQELGVAPSTARALLARENWTLADVSWVLERLPLRIEVEVRQGKAV